MWSHIKPCLQAASDDPARFAGVQVLGVDEHVWHHQDRRRRGPRELTGIVDHSRGGSPHGPLEWTWSQEGLAPCMRTGWPSAEKTSAPVSRSRRWIPSKDSKNAIDDQLQDTTSVLDAFHIVKLAGDALDEVRRRVQQDTLGHSARTGDPLYPGPQSLARLTHAGSPHANKNASVQPSRQMKRISVLKPPTAAPSKCARSSTKTHPPKANARQLVSSSAYQPVPSPKSLAWAGPYASGRTHSTPTSTPTEPATHPTQAIKGHYRTGQTHRQRLPQPHQPPTPNAPHRRRPRRLHPHSTQKSRQSQSTDHDRRVALHQKPGENTL